MTEESGSSWPAVLGMGAAMVIVIVGGQSIGEEHTGVEQEWSIQNLYRTFSGSNQEVRLYVTPVPPDVGELRQEYELAVRQAILYWIERGYSISEAPMGSNSARLDYVREWGGDHGTVGQALGSQHAMVGLGVTGPCKAWTPYSVATFRDVVTHELGHLLGLGHSADYQDVMYVSTDTRYGSPCILKEETRTIPPQRAINDTLDPQVYMWHFEASANGANYEICLTAQAEEGDACSGQPTQETHFQFRRGLYPVEVYFRCLEDFPCEIQYTAYFPPE